MVRRWLSTASVSLFAVMCSIRATLPYLKVNPRKNLTPVDPVQVMQTFGNLVIFSPTPEAQNLGVILDVELSFSSHICNLSQICSYLLNNIRRFRPFLTTGIIQILIQSLIL